MGKKKVNGEKVKRALPFKLTEEDKARKAEQAAQLNKKLEAAVAAKKAEVSKHNLGIKDLTGKLSKCLAIVSEGVERREVQCFEVKNYADSVVEYHYQDEILETRKMTEIDRQGEFKIKPTGKKSEAKEVPRWQKLAPRYERNAHNKKDEDIAEVHRSETSRATATSAVTK